MRFKECVYQESKKCVDVEEEQLLVARSPTWVQGVACVHQVCEFRLFALGLVDGALCVRGKVACKNVE